MAFQDLWMAEVKSRGTPWLDVPNAPPIAVFQYSCFNCKYTCIYKIRSVPGPPLRSRPPPCKPVHTPLPSSVYVRVRLFPPSPFWIHYIMVNTKSRQTETRDSTWWKTLNSWNCHDRKKHENRNAFHQDWYKTHGWEKGNINQNRPTLRAGWLRERKKTILSNHGQHRQAKNFCKTKQNTNRKH